MCWPTQRSLTMAYIYRVCTVYDHVYIMLFVKGNPIASNRMPAKSRLHSSCGCMLNTIILILVIRKVFQPFIVDRMFRPLKTLDMYIAHS